MHGKELTALRPNGYMVISDPEKGILEADTLQCVHCGAHWQIKPGSKRVRGFCFNCNGPICGPKCQKCVPQEQQLENMEAGRAVDFRPIRISVPKLIVPNADVKEKRHCGSGAPPAP